MTWRRTPPIPKPARARRTRRRRTPTSRPRSRTSSIDLIPRTRPRRRRTPPRKRWPTPQQALDQAQKPSDAADKLAKAADAAETSWPHDLGQQQAAEPLRTTSLNPATSNKPTDFAAAGGASKLAQQQGVSWPSRRSRRRTSRMKSRARPGKQAMQEALKQVAQEKQQELNEQASQLPAGQQQKARWSRPVRR